MTKQLLTSVLVLAGVALLIALIVGAGLYNVAADDEHSAAIYRLLETARDRSIAVRAAKIDVPDLSDAQRIRRGAGNYASMCAGCHLEPGAAETELSRGLYPQPPNLATGSSPDPARAFWIIKHGIKATGMPAWGKSMDDPYIWDMVAFLHTLPKLSAAQYAAEVGASEGHAHGGSELLQEQDDHGDEHDESPASADHAHADAPGDGGHAAHEHSHSSPTPASKHAHADDESHSSIPRDALATVRMLHEALSAGNSADVERVLDSNVLIFEGGNVERSREEYAAHHLKSDLKFMRAVKYTLQRSSGDGVGDLAWVASEAVLTGESQGKPIDLLSTESLVLRKTQAGWRVVHIHWSSRSRNKA